MYSWIEEPVFCFTSDIDWASEEIIQFSHHTLSSNDLKLTYFNTHPSKFLNELDKLTNIRILIHPNFLPDSSHGTSFKEVIDNCLSFASNADGFRSHRYFEVNDIMDEFAKRGFKFVSNHCTQCETHIKPLKHRSGLLSIPIFLEDGGYLLMDPTLNFNTLIAKLETPGLKVINFHPAHMAFNTPHFAYTRSIKDGMNREAWNNISTSQIQKMEHKGLGIRNIIQQIIEFTFSKKCAVMSMHQIYNEYLSSKVDTSANG
ncbi:MAG TPA: hypothetical protein VJN02_02260 [Gammaproteobacteria bacterium]|nr:hypothetical protein [Gammaproteobacteria bacterium]